MMMVLSVVSKEGDVMPPHVFTKGLRVNNAEFINILKTLKNRGWTRYRKIAITSSRMTAPMLTTGRGRKVLLKVNLLEM
jgi:hypothetical protein